MKPELSLSYGQVERLLNEMFDVAPDRASAITARFNAIRRMRFPEGVNTGATGRFRYDLEGTMKCLLVFALLDALVMPQQAVTMLKDAWSELSVVIREIVADLEFDGRELVSDDRPSQAPYLVLEPNGLAQLRNPAARSPLLNAGDYRPTRPGELRVVTRDRINGRLASMAPCRVKASLLVIDLFDVVSWTIATIVGAGWADPAVLGARTGGTSSPRLL